MAHVTSRGNEGRPVRPLDFSRDAQRVPLSGSTGAALPKGTGGKFNCTKGGGGAHLSTLTGYRVVYETRAQDVGELEGPRGRIQQLISIFSDK